MTQSQPGPQLHAVLDELRAAGTAYTDAYRAPRDAAPRYKVAIVACMDARLDIPALFGLHPGDAHIIRNAGGTVTDDVIRSLTISQTKLGTQAVLLVHHTDCGQQSYRDADLRRELLQRTGQEPEWSPQAFESAEADVRESIRRITSSHFLDFDAVAGYVFDTATGNLNEVIPSARTQTGSAKTPSAQHH